MSEHAIDTTSPEYQAGFAAGHLAGRRDALLEVQQMLARVTNEPQAQPAAGTTAAAPSVTSITTSVLRLGLPAWIAQKLWDSQRRTVEDVIYTDDHVMASIFRGNRMAVARIDETLHSLGYLRRSSEPSSVRQ